MITAIVLLLRLVQVVLFTELILRWFPVGEGSRLPRVIAAITTPLLLPARTLLSRIRALSRVPFDFSYLLVFIVLEVLIRLIA